MFLLIACLISDIVILKKRGQCAGRQEQKETLGSKHTPKVANNENRTLKYWATPTPPPPPPKKKKNPTTPQLEQADKISTAPKSYLLHTLLTHSRNSMSANKYLIDILWYLNHWSRDRQTERGGGGEREMKGGGGREIMFNVAYGQTQPHPVSQRQGQNTGHRENPFQYLQRVASSSCTLEAGKRLRHSSRDSWQSVPDDRSPGCHATCTAGKQVRETHTRYRWVMQPQAKDKGRGQGDRERKAGEGRGGGGGGGIAIPRVVGVARTRREKVKVLAGAQAMHGQGRRAGRGRAEGKPVDTGQQQQDTTRRETTRPPSIACYLTALHCYPPVKCYPCWPAVVLWYYCEVSLRTSYDSYNHLHTKWLWTCTALHCLPRVLQWGSPATKCLGI